MEGQLGPQSPGAPPQGLQLVEGGRGRRTSDRTDGLFFAKQSCGFAFFWPRCVDPRIARVWQLVPPRTRMNGTPSQAPLKARTARAEGEQAWPNFNKTYPSSRLLISHPKAGFGRFVLPLQLHNELSPQRVWLNEAPPPPSDGLFDVRENPKARTERLCPPLQHFSRRRTEGIWTRAQTEDDTRHSQRQQHRVCARG